MSREHTFSFFVCSPHPHAEQQQVSIGLLFSALFPACVSRSRLPQPACCCPGFQSQLEHLLCITWRRKSRKRFKKRKLFESFEPEALPGYSSAGGYASAEPDYASAGYGGPRGGEAAVPLGSHCVQHGWCACIRSTMNTYSASPSSGGCAQLCCAALAGMHPSLHDAATVEVTQPLMPR